ncbi:hypothetical protein [Furfurilactobacillus entadae]|uniref:hypothetical protein n=1 Tax=Furfurilactobacillus entadae TaxID=2922307 RepID=UPI0035EE8675
MDQEERYQLLTRAEKRQIIKAKQAFATLMGSTKLAALQKEEWRKVIYYEVKRTNFGYRNRDSEADLRAMFHVVEILKHYTPREFMNIFPVDKDYLKPGADWKDYFSTMRMIHKQGIDELIKEPYEFLTDYMNNETMLFIVRLTVSISHQRERQGGKSLLSEFFGLEQFG